MSAVYIDLHLGIDNARRLNTKLYDKRDEFNLQSSKATKTRLRYSLVEFISTKMIRSLSSLQNIHDKGYFHFHRQ